MFAAIGFVGVTAIFAREMSAFRSSVLEWASHDLKSRTEIAVSTLREPLGTGDFGAVHSFNRQCAADGVRLSVFGKPNGGLVFDSLGGFTDSRRDRDYLYGQIEDVGGFEVMLGLPLERVLAPFRRAKHSLVLAALVGMTGMFFLFAAFYRQRVRIRELAKLEKFRRDFIADVSHEIRTPLTGILGAAEMLEAGDGVQARLVGMIRGESKRLESLVQQILDLARLEREGDVLSLADTDIAALVSDLAEKYGVRSDCGETDGGALVAKCDAQLVSQAVSNLIVNAQRHSGTADIAVSARRIPGGGVEIAVEDHGKGVPPEHAARIFERFHRADPARAAESGGAGLGLAIVRRIARLHGGDAVYEPAKPCGSRFAITLRRGIMV